jgi:hypothetical protein
MNDLCRKQKRVTQCEPTSLGGEHTKPVCEPFSVCLPFGRSLVYNGECLSVEGDANIPDGEYGVIVVENGCIVSARPNPVFEYTPGPCAPAAASCGDSGGGSGGGSIDLQPNACNLSSLDGAGRLGTYLSVTAGSGINISGCGSTSSPLVISSNPVEASKTYVQSEDTGALTITGQGSLTDPYILGLVPVMANPGTYVGFTVNEYGQITKYAAPDGSTSVLGVVAGPGIEAVNTAGIVTVSLSESGIDAGHYVCGGYDLSLDLAGRVIGVDQIIDITEQTFDPYDNAITVNGLGSITAVTPVVRETANIGRHHTHSVGQTTVSDSFNTDRSGSIYVAWFGYEVISTITIGGTTGGTSGTEPVLPDLDYNKYTDKCKAYINVTVNEQETNDYMGIFRKDYTFTAAGVLKSIEIALVEVRCKLDNQQPGTYTVSVTKVDETAFENQSVLEMCCAS